MTWFHRLLADRLLDVEERRVRRLIVAMPPRHGKTELVSRLWPAWLFRGSRPLRIIACSHTANLAEQNSRDVRRIMQSRRYRAAFPSATIPIAHTDQRLKSTAGHWELPTGGVYRAAGVGGPITGHGFDVGIIDDPLKNREEADSATIRERIWQWYTSTFYTRQEPDAAIILISTRWHRDDLVGRLLRQRDNRLADQWQIVTLPAIATTEPAPGDPREPGEPLWPERFGAEALATVQSQDPRNFACMYQQDPGAAGGTEWPADLFGELIWVDENHWPKSFDVQVIALDPSKGRQDRDSDYSAIVSVGVRDGLVYVDADLDRRPTHQIIRDMLLWCDRIRPDYVAIEANQFQELLIHEFERACGQHFGVRWPVYKIVNTVPKPVRIRRLGQYLASRELRFRRSPGARLLVDQLMDFPFGEHDDGPDALEMAIRLILELAGGGPCE